MSNDTIKKHIEKFGWHFLNVFDSNGEKPDFAYSVGFEESYNHPEIIIFGLKKDTAHAILSDIANELKSGMRYEPSQRYGDVIGGDFEVLFKPVKENAFDEYLGIACNYYDESFRTMVMFWPDKSNVLPTENGCELTLQNEAIEIV